MDDSDAPPTRRPPLDRATVLAAAVRLVDAQGISELSMRRLARELGYEAMALYRYVPSRDDLLDAVVDRVVDEMYAAPEMQLTPDDDWRDYLRRLAHAVRAMALAHPRLFPLVATRPPEAGWLRPPLRSLRWVEAFLDGLGDKGFDDDTAVYVYRAFTSFLLGHLLLEVAALGVESLPGQGTESAAPSRRASLDEFPNLMRLAPKLREDQAAAEFEESLNNLVQRLALAREEGVVRQRTSLTDD